ncbi:MAG: HemK family protein methyltransferase [Candidatus Wildermuthbacteria bacterium]|nr:HemK family protein methyltransferase [Candidatus Wildermuthbacteria bacterium]
MDHIDYVAGSVEFLKCRIDLSKRPMIPRPETEYWTEQAITELRKRVLEIVSPSQLRCLDLFAGSGCIGIAVLKHVPGSFVDFGEKEKKLLSQIRINAKLNHIPKNRYRVIQSDVFSNVKEKYDCIFANPPYVALSKISRVQESVLEHEPLSAIFGGEDGLRFIRPLLKEARFHLKPGGTLYFEFDSWQKKAIETLLKKNQYTSFKFHKDQYGNWRYLSAY